MTRRAKRMLFLTATLAVGTILLPDWPIELTTLPKALLIGLFEGIKKVVGVVLLGSAFVKAYDWRRDFPSLLDFDDED